MNKRGAYSYVPRLTTVEQTTSDRDGPLIAYFDHTSYDVMLRGTDLAAAAPSRRVARHITGFLNKLPLQEAVDIVMAFQAVGFAAAVPKRPNRHLRHELQRQKDEVKKSERSKK